MQVANNKLLTIPNLITLSRLPICLAGIAVYGYGTDVGGVALVALAGLTDMFDGKIARRTHSVSTFGIKADPVIDKLYMTAVSIFVFIISDNVPARITIGVLFLTEALIGLYSLYVHFMLIGGAKFRVVKAGKRAMALKMASFCLLAIATLLNGGLSIASLVVGIIFGVVGSGLSLIALRKYYQIQNLEV